MRISVRSRAPWRPSLPEACRSLSTSSGVRYSRLRLEALDWRAGGRGEAGVDRARRSNGFLLRRREAIFPFTSIGEDFSAAEGFLTLIDKWHGFFSAKWPLMVRGLRHAGQY